MAHWFKHRNRSARQCSKVFGKLKKENKMKKIIILIATFLPILAHGENMCVKNGSVMVVLDPQIGGTALTSEATGKTWSAQFPYGIISGIGGCSSNGVCTTAGCVPTNQNITPYQAGKFCYCKMLHPIESVFVWAGGYDVGNGDGSCRPNCAAGCAKYVAQSVVLRSSLFGNVIE